MNNLQRGIGGALLSFAFVFGIFAATSGTAQAQDRNWHRNDDRRDRRNRDNDRWDRNRDSRRRQNNDAWRRNRNNGINNRNDGVYNNSGVYNNGRYGRNSGYGNYGGYNQVDLNRGFQQGINTGSSDARRGQSYSPQRSHFFRNPSSQAFRDGFVRGYDQGYRQYSGYGNQRYRTNNGNWGNILGGILGRP